MTTSTPPPRKAARAIVLDTDDRVLLLRYDEGGDFWATPGGSVEEGETDTVATLRELSEELGLDANAVQLGAQLAERTKDHLVGGREVRQVEKYFLARIAASAADSNRATQPDNIRETRWWNIRELRTTTETVYPAGLADLIAAVVEGRMPQRPVVLD
ncbi:NUDIX hydrolase [Streptomyces mirabilis]|uniref:NUDIX hydrolase n=1 Tax=Streptomyces mirabilis TaxID=68239 RepID=UPI0033D66480